MKNIEVIFQNGQLVDAISKDQVFLVPGKHYFINGDDNAFTEDDYLIDDVEVLNEMEKLIQISTKYEDFKTEKILSAGQLLYFRIGLGKKTSEDMDAEFLFEAKILEDLYLKNKEGLNWTLCECKCETNNLIEGTLPFVHNITGNSLSNLFANVVTHYFSYKRSTACNAFTTFALKRGKESPSLNWIKTKRPILLADIRCELTTIKSK